MQARHDVSATGRTAKIELQPPPVGLGAVSEDDMALAAGDPVTQWPLKWAAMEKQAEGRKERELCTLGWSIYHLTASHLPRTTTRVSRMVSQTQKPGI